MSFRAARQVFSSTARSSLRPTARASKFSGTTGRRMNSSHAPNEFSSDKNWIIASAVIFGPAFLYLLSPSARKTHFVHNDAHDFPSAKHAHSAPTPVEAAANAEEEPEPVIMADDEGKEENVAASIQKAEADDVPNSDGASPATESKSVPESQSAVEAANSITTAETEEPTAASGATASEAAPINAEAPTDIGEAREAAVEGVPPKEQKEKAESS